MNQLTKTLTEYFKPTMLLTIYSQHEDLNSQNINSTFFRENTTYYLESHDIDGDGNVLAGKPLKQETIQSMVDLFFDDSKNRSKVTGLIPDNMLSFSLLQGGHYKMIWYRPAEVRVIHHAKELKLPTAKAWVPATLYKVERGRLYVYALGTDRRPTEASVLYRAPYFNVDDSGLVCLGSAHVKEPKVKTYATLLKYWEDLFWLSKFTHVNGSEKVKSNDLQKAWKKIMASKTRTKWKPSQELIKHKQKLGYIL